MKSGRGAEGAREENVEVEEEEEIGKEKAEDEKGTEEGREAKPESDKGNNNDVRLREGEGEEATLRISREIESWNKPKPGAP